MKRFCVFLFAAVLLLACCQQKAQAHPQLVFRSGGGGCPVVGLSGYNAGFNFNRNFAVNRSFAYDPGFAAPGYGGGCPPVGLSSYNAGFGINYASDLALLRAERERQFFLRQRFAGFPHRGVVLRIGF